MGIDDQLSAAIERRWLQFVAGTEPELADRRALALRVRALPLYADLGACIAIRADGELISVVNDQDPARPGAWTREVDARWRTVALAVGSWSYPELKALLPARPPDAEDCPTCASTGRWPGPETLAGPVCGACLGLGWRPGAATRPAAP